MRVTVSTPGYESGRIYLSPDRLTWWDGAAWRPPPAPPGLTPVPPWWDGYAWRWDAIPVATPAAHPPTLRRIARAGVWVQVVIIGLFAVGMATTTADPSNLTSSTQLVLGACILAAGTVGLAVVGALWGRLPRLVEVVIAVECLPSVAMAVAFLPLMLITVPLAAPTVIGVWVAEATEERTTEMSRPAGAYGGTAVPVLAVPPLRPAITPGMFAAVASLAAAGFVFGLLAGFNPNVTGNDPLPAGLLGLAIGAIIGVGSAGVWHSQMGPGGGTPGYRGPKQ
jgi:hypothetical protein